MPKNRIATLTDIDGTPHTYEVFPHPATDGQDIFWRLVAIASEPGAAFFQKILESGDIVDQILQGIRAHLAAGEVDEARKPDAADASLVDTLRGCNFGALGQDIRRTIVTSNMPGLAKDLLRHTLRDGKPLGEQVHFDEAYTANWGEYAQALLLVIDANRFFALLGTFFAAEVPKK